MKNLLELPYDSWVLTRLQAPETLAQDLLEQANVLPIDLDDMADKMDISDAVRLSTKLIETHHPRQLKRLNQILLNTLELRPCAFYLHLLAINCCIRRQSMPLIAEELTQMLSYDSEHLRLGAWITQTDPVQAIRQIPLANLYQTLERLVRIETELGPLYLLHMLGGLLAAEGNWNSTSQRCRATPLFHSLMRELYRHLPQIYQVLPQMQAFLEKLDGASHVPAELHQRFAPLKVICNELAALPLLDARVRKQWEKRDRASDQLRTSIDKYLKQIQSPFSLRLGNLNAFFRQISQTPEEEGGFIPVQAEMPMAGCCYHFTDAGDWVKDQRLQKNEARASRQDVYLQWLAGSFQHFRGQYWLQQRQYSTLWIEDGEISFLFLLWALWRLAEDKGHSATLSPTIEDLGHGLSPDWLEASGLSISSFEQILDGPLGFFQGPEKVPSPRFWAFYDFVLREQHYQDKSNTLLVPRLRKLARTGADILAGAGNPRERMLQWCVMLSERLKEASLGGYIAELRAKGYFSLMLSEMVLRKGERYPRVLFLHPLISEKWRASDSERYAPYLLVSGHLLSAPGWSHWPFSARRCSALLWPAINWLSFALTDSLFMGQVRAQQERMIHLERERRQKENFTRVAGKLEQIFGLERQLNTLLENVRQSITPPSMSAFGIGNWREFSLIFHDQAEMQLQDGTRLYGNHSSRAVTAADLDAYLRYISEKIEPTPDSFIPLFQQAWELSDRSVHIARKCFGLLKLICYDSNDRNKDLYWCQLLVALRALGSEPRVPLRIQATRMTSQGHADLAELFAKSDAHFLLALLDEMDPKIESFKYATDARWRVTHSFNLAPVELLESIAWLTHQELQPDPESLRDRVRLNQVKVNLKEVNKGQFQLTLTWHCQGVFSDLNKLLSEDSHLYHSTRYHLGVLARSVGIHWQPIPVQTLQQADLLLESPPSPLMLLSCSDADQTWLQFQLGAQPLTESIIQTQSKQFEDLEA